MLEAGTGGLDQRLGVGADRGDRLAGKLDRTLAEIGAAQEVARWLFRVGGAAGTIAKSISAYDMQVSDAIYGEAARYVSRERLQAMLDAASRAS